MSGPNKYQIYEENTSEGVLDLELKYEDANSHGSMVYGFDFREMDEKQLDVWSCSFYDGFLIRTRLGLSG